MKEYEIIYRLKERSSVPMQKMRVTATDTCTARSIFQQQNPGAVISSTPREISRKQGK